MTSKSIVDHFGDLPDPREDNRRHLLIDILVIVIRASVCAAEKWNDIEEFGRAKDAWVFSRIDPQALNIDGKTLAQMKVDEKSNEITAITEQIVDREADCVLALEGNKSLHHEQVKLVLHLESSRRCRTACSSGSRALGH